MAITMTADWFRDVDALATPEFGRWNRELNQYNLPYDVVRTAADPDEVLMEFLTTTYDAAASAGKWDRAALEGPFGVPGRPRPV